MLNKLQLQHLELQLQNLDQPLCLKSEQKFNFMTKRQLPNQQIIANMVLSINISKVTTSLAILTTTTSFELASSHAKVTLVKSTSLQVEHLRL